MSLIRRLCLVYAVILLGAAAINYIPGLTDEAGLAFGIFALDPFDDALHLVSAIWAFLSGLISNRSARTFLILFGAAYLGDGILGIFTGWGYLDFGIFTNEALGMDWSYQRIMANLPHIALGFIALAAGVAARRA
ncbi:hypothetical protein [Gymnodinialimonas ceratoperidinii]|uniref:DUF4383 domain-containing protein n=1 Tax=Gymnodinialimonas ceratoperidinii TaxID=2856823 RepID=A0A8F6Y9V5_9RHOB|nr:hypothetical protein [Gymnodinialimonas ceratoperidinii]QXT38933.1 hypothetical protein KYE46_13455 [Gymnodinialimonas ceratoperidinii]